MTSEQRSALLTLIMYAVIVAFNLGAWVGSGAKYVAGLWFGLAFAALLPFVYRNTTSTFKETK